MKTTSGIYIILNTLNDKVYVGSSVNLRARWLKHIATLIANTHDNDYLQSAWNKQNGEGFIFVSAIILICEMGGLFTPQEFKYFLMGV